MAYRQTLALPFPGGLATRGYFSGKGKEVSYENRGTA